MASDDSALRTLPIASCSFVQIVSESSFLVRITTAFQLFSTWQSRELGQYCARLKFSNDRVFCIDATLEEEVSVYLYSSTTVRQVSIEHQV